MEIFICVLLLLVGLILIVKGGDWFVDAASWIAEVSGVPSFVIGATIVSLATTLPEILVSCISAGEGSVDLAIGNAVGSVNANIALIMALSLLFMPVAFKRKDYLPKSLLLLAAISVLWAVCANGELTFGLSFIVLAIFAAFIAENLYAAKKSASAPLTAADTIQIDDYNAVSFSQDFKLNSDGTVSGKRTRKKTEPKEMTINIVKFIFGAAGIAGGAILLSNYGEELALLLGVPAGIVGVTIIAVGTSLPELTTTIIAISKKKSDLSVGNVIGANIIDMTLILPLCSFISQGTTGAALPVSAQTLTIDLPFCLAAAAVALIPSLITGKFHRWQGAVLLAGYAVYITLLVLNVTGQVNLF